MQEESQAGNGWAIVSARIQRQIHRAAALPCCPLRVSQALLVPIGPIIKMRHHPKHNAQLQKLCKTPCCRFQVVMESAPGNQVSFRDRIVHDLPCRLCKKDSRRQACQMFLPRSLPSFTAQLPPVSPDRLPPVSPAPEV